MNIKDGIKKVKLGLCYLGLGLATYRGLTVFPALVDGALSPKIKSQSQLEQTINEERKKIDSKNNSKIIAEIIPQTFGGTKKIGDKTYLIKIGGDYCNTSTVRHELYHILRGHCEHKNTNLKDFFYSEPTAELYEATGIKL